MRGNATMKSASNHQYPCMLGLDCKGQANVLVHWGRVREKLTDARAAMLGRVRSLGSDARVLGSTEGARLVSLASGEYR